MPNPSSENWTIRTPTEPPRGPVTKETATELRRDPSLLIVQAAPDRPVFRGVSDDGRDVVCALCKDVVLLHNVPINAVFDLEIKCAGCGGVNLMPAFPPGRGLGGVLRTVTLDHRA